MKQIRDIDNELSINNLIFEICLDQIYPTELEIKGMIESNTNRSYLDLTVNREGQSATHFPL